MAFSVGDVNSTCTVRADTMDEVELAGFDSVLAPRKEVLSTLRIFYLCTLGLSVAVGDVNFAGFWIKSRFGGPVKGFTTLIRSRFVRGPDGEEDFPFRCAFVHTVTVIVHAVEGVVGADSEAVRAGKDFLAPRSDKRAVGFEDDHGMVTAIEDVDAVVGVHRNIGASWKVQPSGSWAQSSCSS